MVGSAAIGAIALGVAWVRWSGGEAPPAGHTAFMEMRGGVFGPVELQRLGGSKFEIVTFRAEGRQLVLLYAPECPACQRARPVWEGLVSALPVERSVYAISVNPVDADADSLPFFHLERIREWRGTGRALARAIPSPLVPVTLVLSGTGVVEEVWIGVPSGSAVQRFAEMLGAGKREGSGVP